MSKNSELLTFLSDYADQKFTEEELRSSVLPSATATQVTTTLWALQKLGVVKFKEKHTASGSMLYDIQYRKAAAKRLGRDAILFDLAATTTATAAPTQAQIRRETLEHAARLLEEAGEVTLAILVLDAMEGKQRDLSLYAPPTAKRPMVYLPGSGRTIRQLSPDEAETFWKLFESK